jgi:2,3-bisphosphoglycerate-independent phosphoglycerate mutase
MDGRDVSPVSGKDFIKELQQKIKEIGTGQIATVLGRFYGMDRENQWGRVKMGYDAVVNGIGVKNPDPYKAVLDSYESVSPEGKAVTDEFIVPVVCAENARVMPNDSFIFFNFRPDRAREITRAIVDGDFTGFKRERVTPLYYVCMTEYDATMPDVHIAYEPKALTMTMGEYISKQGLTQLRIAETTKYAHVTFFYNGGEEVMFPGEDRELIKTPDVATFDLMPEMSAHKVCDAAVEHILSGKYDMVILNFANCDMVGHTGIFEAAVKAVEAVDECVGRVAEAVLRMGGVNIITADHGNADKMYDGAEVFTAHTTNPVPLIVAGRAVKLREGGRLCDISPTMLDLMGLVKPDEMEGESLIKR